MVFDWSRYFVISLSLLGVAAADAHAQATTSLVSVNNAGQQGNRGSSEAAISDDGDLVAFSSASTNLVSGDVNNLGDIFVRQRDRRLTRLISRGVAGAGANGASTDPAVSGDGRVVAFVSLASNLVAGDSNARADIFLRAVTADSNRLISVAKGGVPANAESLQPAVSSTGRWVAFVSRASNLIADDRNSAFDIFLRDRDRGVTTRVSTGPTGAEANGSSLDALVSANGGKIAFSSEASNLVAGDGNALQDAFIHDRVSRATRLLSVGRGGPANGRSFPLSISKTGRYVAFTSTASNLVPGDSNAVADVFVRDTVAGRTERISIGAGGAQANGVSDAAAISADGRKIAFRSRATNLVPGDTNASTDIFLRDLDRGTISRLSVASSGAQAKPGCFDVALSANGRIAAFSCDATNLVAGDVNSASDVFVRAPLPAAAARLAADR